MTHMEILCGAYRDRNPNALFLFRHPCYLQALPEKFLGQFVEADSYTSTAVAGATKGDVDAGGKGGGPGRGKGKSYFALEELKRNIVNRFSSSGQVADYSVSVSIHCTAAEYSLIYCVFDL